MSKVKRKSTFIDMTAMSDVTVLLLTFFMLTATFVQKEPVKVNTPSSISEIKIPDHNILQILVDKEGKVFFSLDRHQDRQALLQMFTDSTNVQFTQKERKNFTDNGIIGVAFKSLKVYLDASDEQRTQIESGPNGGVPVDSTETNSNELRTLISYAMNINPNLTLALKADGDTKYTRIRDVMNTLNNMGQNRFNLITNLDTNIDKKE